MPDDLQGMQNPPQDEYQLERLLAGAAQREADKKMKELEEKGIVTKAEFSTALQEFGMRLTETITSTMADQLKKAVGDRQALEAAQATDQQDSQSQDQVAAGVRPEQVQKGQRRGTVQGASDPRSDNPVRYLIQKSRAGHDFDDMDKALIWGLTERGLSQGMTYYSDEIADFGDDSAY